jgi:peptidoglycan/xylan/chitin deacetylase (PgdA/CDA1 family)
MSGCIGGYGYSFGEKTGGVALLLALLLGYFTIPQAAAIPLFLFLLACLGAPFFPQVSFFLPVISRGKPDAEGIALTFDDGPFPASTPVLLDLLAKYQLQATFFVTGEHAAAHPELIAAMLAHGHTIGNHSYRHDHLLMLRSCRTLHKDIQATQKVLGTAGIRPLVFRPPVGITSPRLQPVLASLGMQAVTFSCRTFDGGNRNIRNLAARVLKRLRPGDILLLHENPPQNETTKAYWYNELDHLFATLRQAYRVVPLAALIDQPIMRSLEKQPD